MTFDKLDALLSAFLAASNLLNPATPADPRLECMAVTAFGEARGEPLAGVQAVIHTMINRERKTGRSICDIARRAYDGFRVWEDRPEHPSDVEPDQWVRAVAVAALVDNGVLEGPCASATHFYNPDKAQPYWAEILPETCVVGRHRFMEES